MIFETILNHSSSHIRACNQLLEKNDKTKFEDSKQLVIHSNRSKFHLFKNILTFFFVKSFNPQIMIRKISDLEQIKNLCKFLLLHAQRLRRAGLPLSASSRITRSLGRSLSMSPRISTADDCRSL